jgi:hypothetical protein
MPYHSQDHWSLFIIYDHSKLLDPNSNENPYIIYFDSLNLLDTSISWNIKK